MSLTPDPTEPAERQPGRLSRLAVWGRRLVRRRPRLTAVAVVVVVALVGIGVRAWVTRDPGGPGWARSPRSAVQGYLDAVADGRAADALAYVSRPPADRTFLTDAVLAQSRELAPMTEVVVGKESSSYGSDERCRYDCTVRAEYRLGGEQTKVSLTVTEDDGYWFVDMRPQAVQLVGYRDYDGIGSYHVPVVVNGTSADIGTDDVVLFPGRYHVTSGHPLVDIDTTFTVEPGKDRSDDPTVRLRPTLTADGKERVAEAAQVQIDACLAQASFDTGCGFLNYDSTRFAGPADPTTITWTLTGDTVMPQPGGELDDSYGTPRSWHRLAVTVPVAVRPRCTWTTVAGQVMEWEPYMAPDLYVADLTDPDNITVTFIYS